MISDFILRVSECGYRVSGPVVPDGRIHRVNWRPDSGSGKPGWYAAFDHGEWMAVAWGDWREGWREVWTSKSERRMSPGERASLIALTTRAREAEELERRKAGDSARRRAQWIWNNADIDTASHQYLERKGVAAEGLRVREFDGRKELLVPLRDSVGNLGNLQRIQADGTKLFVKSAGVTGLSWRAGPLPSGDFTGDIVVTEGMATAATVRQLSGATVFAAMNSGNLPAVTAWIRKAWAGARILIAADDDRWERDGTSRPVEKNAGRTAAAKAAENTRALIILPLWTNLQSRGTDWNDLFTEEGEASTLAKWKNAIAIAALDRQTAVMTDAEYGRRRGELQAAYAAAGGAKMGARELDQRRKGTKGTVSGQESAEPQPPQVLLSAICAEAELWHDQFGIAFATLPHDGVTINAKVESAFFRDWMRVRYDEESGGGLPPGREMLNSIVERAASTARLRAPRCRSHYRMGHDPADNAYWLDLGRRDWRMVRYDAAGWRVMDVCPIKFTHSDGDCALPIPEINPELGGLDCLWEILNVAPEDRCLVAGFLLGAMMPAAPCFGLNLYGGQGTAKSTATKILRRLLDPQPASFQSLSERRIEDLGLTCVQQWIPCFENISRIDPDVQDVLCSLTTDLAARSRKLFTDGEIISYEIRRPWIINGINNVCSRNDLAERAIPVALMAAPHESRKREKIIYDRFEAIRPHVLAVLLDAAVEAQRSIDQARDFLERHRLTHRMADALEWITAGEETMGFTQGSFITRLNQLQEDAGFESLDGNPVLGAIELLLEDNTRGYWQGTHEEILQKMQAAYPESKRNKYLPHDAIGIGNWLRRETDRLRKSFGIQIGERRKVRINHRRVWQREIQRIETANDNDSDTD